MDIHQQWLVSEHEKKQRSDNLSRSFYAAKLFVIPLVIPWAFLDGTQLWARVVLSAFYAIAFSGVLTFRKRLPIGSFGRYVANYVAAYSGMFLMLFSAFSVGSAF